MAVKINKAQRDWIYPEAIVALSGTGDIRIELDNGDFDSARRHRRRFEGRDAAARRHRLGARPGS
jgi:hypothetical protein